MKKIIITLMAFGIVTVSLAQNGAARQYSQLTSRSINLEEEDAAFGLTKGVYEGIKAQAYINENFIAGTIYKDNQIIQQDVPMRYNAFSDQIEMENNNSVSALIKDPDLIVKILNNVYVLVPLNGSNEDGGYFNLVMDGEHYDLYKKTKATFIQPYYAKTSYESDRDPRFDKVKNYYLVSNGKFYEIPNRESQIMKVMDDKKKEVKSFMKKNTLDLDEEKDLAKIIKYYDSLQ